eukprot:Opistho-1_new@10473
MSRVVAGFGSLSAEVILVHIVPYLANADVCRLCKVNSFLRRFLSNERLLYLWPLYTRRYIDDAAFREEFQATLPVGRLVLAVGDAKHTYGPQPAWNASILPAFANVHTADLRGATGECDGEPGMQALRGVRTIHMDAIHSTRTDCPPTVNAHSGTLEHVNPGHGDLSVLANAPRVRLLDVRVPAVSGLRPRHIILEHSVFEDVSSLVVAESVPCPKVPLSQIAALRGLVKVILRHSSFRAIPAELAGVHTLDLSFLLQPADRCDERPPHTHARADVLSRRGRRLGAYGCAHA